MMISTSRPLWRPRFVGLLASILSCVTVAAALAANPTPYLRQQGAATQPVVNGQPLGMLAGELHNSSSSSLDYMEPIWPKLTALNLNTVIASISWVLVEPEEGKFDFTLVDRLIKDARQHDLKLVFIWFATWKSGDGSWMPRMGIGPNRASSIRILPGYKVTLCGGRRLEGPTCALSNPSDRIVSIDLGGPPI